ncbi:MAG: ABC transporter ATP-binding protein [Bacteriovoracaceae bacterium]|nr:ABC transporter ATP-binding protein [Bacteriovoracaceae bacterium]
MIQVKNLSKSFESSKGLKLAVNDVSFSVEPGDVLAFLGPNGAGKSTTMKMMTGFLNPTGGTVNFGALNVQKNTKECQQIIGYVPENAPLYSEMTVADFLQFCGEARGLQNLEEKLKDISKSCYIENVLDEKIENLSKGYKRRVSIAQALIHDPKFLILDEPTDGLDPNQKQQIRELLKKQAQQNKTIVISTHILEEVDAICNKVVLIADGKIKFSGTVEEFKKNSSKGKLEEVFRALTSSSKEVLYA